MGEIVPLILDPLQYDYTRTHAHKKSRLNKRQKYGYHQITKAKEQKFTEDFTNYYENVFYEAFCRKEVLYTNTKLAYRLEENASKT